MRLSIFFVAALTAYVLSDSTSLQAQECKCAGSPIGLPFSGGNSQPLKWVYSTYLVNSPPPPQQKLICYFKEVENKGNSEVRDVRWEVANFFRRIVPKGAMPSACPELAGDTKPAPTNGPLYFGPSSQGYDTTVLQPKDGWGESASNVSTDGLKGGGALIRTALAFAIEDAQGKVGTARLNFVSAAKSDGDKVYLSYTVENEGDVDFAVLVNLSATPTILDKVPMIQRPLTLAPGAHATYDVFTEGRGSIEPAAIVVYDMNKRISAIDAAGFYTVAGKKERTDSSFWESIR